MIVKNLEPLLAQNPRAAAGQKAEQEMAFYLRRAFKDNPNLFVYNSLRFVFGEDVAQIDHLILHKYGVMIIESKSVTTKVEINDRGEWMRWYGRTVQGMASPVLQARRQADFLKKYLNAHAGDLLGKLIGFQKRFGGMEVDILVAISDGGIIKRPRSKVAVPEEVLKADQVVDRVQAIYSRHQKANRLSSLLSPSAKEGGYIWSGEELARIQRFLLDRHRPAPIESLTPTNEILFSKPTEPPPAKPDTNTRETVLLPKDLYPQKDMFSPKETSPLKTSTIQSPQDAASESNPICAICGLSVTEAVFQYCQTHADRFGGRVLCFQHQRQRQPPNKNNP